MNPIRLLMHRNDIPTPDRMEELLASATTKANFGKLGIELAASFAANVEDLISLSKARRERNDGILRGLAVRAVKLLDRLTSEISLGHGEMELVYLRLLDDTLITLGYLLVAGPTAFDGFIAESVPAQKLRSATIEARISERGGDQIGRAHV